MLKHVLISLIVLFMTGLLIIAQSGYDDLGNPNDPRLNDRANACYESGTMADKCDSELEWQAGWYRIRFEYGLLGRGEVPAWVAWVLPPEIIPEELPMPGPVPPTTCTINFIPATFPYTTFGSNVTVLISTVIGNDNGGTPGALWNTGNLFYTTASDGARLSIGSVWDTSQVASTDCPTPIPF